jgi:acyl-CoA synthetase (AMP-forming)/AMP-acid ligase II
VLEFLTESALRFGDRAALLAPDDRGDRVISYRELARQALLVAGGLSCLGMRRGDAIALWLTNIPEWVVLEFAAAALGLLVVGVNTRYRSAELSGILGTARPRCLVVQPDFLGIDFRGMIACCCRGLEFAPYVIELPGGYRGLLTGHGSRRHCEGTPHDLVNVFTTSGTTAAPKMAAHSQASIVTHAYHVARGFDLAPGAAMLCVLPFNGVFGYSGLMGALAGGATCILQTTFDAARALDVMVRFGVTHLNGTDAMLQALLRVPGFDYTRLRLRAGGWADFHGGLPQGLRELEERTVRPMAGLGGTYGSSELFALLSRWPAELPNEARARPGGRFLGTGIDVRGVDPASGRVLAHGEPGELQFRGYAVMAGYVRHSQATADAMTEDGWFRSGDLGYSIDAGSFVYLARINDSLRLSGFLVDPREIEAFLTQHEAVEVAQVVGLPQPGQGDVPVAFVKLRANAGTGEKALIAYCHSGIAAYKVPRHVFFVDAFPTTPSANGDKVQKARLREIAAEYVAALRRA